MIKQGIKNCSQGLQQLRFNPLFNGIFAFKSL
jgi:hypothetical protein